MTTTRAVGIVTEVHVIRSLMHAYEREVYRLDPGRWITAREAGGYGHPGWGDRQPQVAVLINGRKVEDDRLDEPIPPGSLVIVAPVLGAEVGYVVLYALLVAIISAAVNLAINAIIGPPKRASAARGPVQIDDSPTWSGVRTTYGPGFRIPIVYGVPRVGGQVIGSALYELGERDVTVGETEPQRLQNGRRPCSDDWNTRISSSSAE
jgi:hypothetical protein